MTFEIYKLYGFIKYGCVFGNLHREEELSFCRWESREECEKVLSALSAGKRYQLIISE